MANGEIKEWFYGMSGKIVGPFSEKEMTDMIKSKKINYGNVVWRCGYSDWVSIEGSELGCYLSSVAPPPLPRVRVSNTVVWILAVAPILSTILILITLILIHHGNEYRISRAYYHADFWWFALVLNITLSLVDERCLKKSGINTTKLRWWIWLPPVYLFQRAKALKQNYAYLIVWIGCFAISRVF